MDVEVDVARDFSEFPFGRYPEHGPFNGTRFREEKLIPPLTRGVRVVVDLSGARGLAASFLEEAFGGLVRQGLTVAALEEQLVVKSAIDPSLADEVWFYIGDAAKAISN
ncbi:MAG: STAS-like domain-containing protein [Brevundimonas sp.]|uniref:STAS-like domain-containing protein n=1 Tax=Brevundimonas sp. TaxID=1871086 RepID=UPI002725EBDA|nr:STAS-like domain-containing protein [Brevundimonas sp.]MDO9607445.1 STAS-like domain-containing protein [Brevundimonas sp.]